MKKSEYIFKGNAWARLEQKKLRCIISTIWQKGFSGMKYWGFAVGALGTAFGPKRFPEVVLENSTRRRLIFGRPRLGHAEEFDLEEGAGPFQTEKKTGLWKIKGWRKNSENCQVGCLFTSTPEKKPI